MVPILLFDYKGRGTFPLAWLLHHNLNPISTCDILQIDFIGRLTAAIGDTIAIIKAPGQAWNW